MVSEWASFTGGLRGLREDRSPTFGSTGSDDIDIVYHFVITLNGYDNLFISPLFCFEVTLSA